MNLLAVSINHRTAPVELREAVYLTEDEIKAFIKEAKEKLFKEGLVLSTCNRTEIYGVPQKEGMTHSHIQDFIQQNKSAGDLKPEHFQTLSSQEAVKHLFNISTGIDSMLIGDNQIFKQVKDLKLENKVIFTAKVVASCSSKIIISSSCREFFSKYSANQPCTVSHHKRAFKGLRTK